MIQASMRIVAPKGKREEVLQVLQRMLGPTAVSKGCRSCRILCDVDDAAAITYVTRWDTQEDMKNHLVSDRFRRILPYVELSLQRPEVEFTSIELLGGLELLIHSLQTQD